VTIPDDRTIRFALGNPHPEWPFLMALPTSTPVPRARNTGASDESEFVASGPYMVDGHGQTSTLVLTKNPNWEPGSDPIRHQYLDSIVVDFHSGSGEEQTNRLIADRGNDQYAVATAAVAPSKIEKVRTDPGLKARTGSAPTLTVDYIHINTSRVTEVKVRQALNWSFDRKAFVVAAGGTENDAHEAHPPTAALPATWILAPVVPGWKDYDAYKSADDDGDLQKARELLAGDTPALTYCFPDTPAQQPFADVVRNSLARAGFHITPHPIDPSSYDVMIGDVTNRCDLVRSRWTAAYPDARSTLDPLLNGEHIVLTGNHNYSLFNDPMINRKIDDLNTWTDLGQVANLYPNLDQEIMTNHAPVIPTYTPRVFNLHGSKAHVFASSLYAEFNLVSAWVG